MFNVALANSGVDLTRVSAHGRMNGADAWPIRCKIGCRPSSTGIGCTRDHARPYHRSCGTFLHRYEFAVERMACLWTLSGSAGDMPAMAAGIVWCACWVCPEHRKANFIELYLQQYVLMRSYLLRAQPTGDCEIVNVLFGSLIPTITFSM